MSEAILFGAAFVSIVPTMFVILVVVPAAYRNGVTDGYGYAKEPSCPGYQSAGEYLRKTMVHRWPELVEDQAAAEEAVDRGGING